MEDTKKPWQSSQLWLNLILALLALFYPKGSEFIANNPQVSVGVITAANFLLRWFKSKKEVKLLK